MSPSLKVAVGKGKGYKNAEAPPKTGNTSFPKVRRMEGWTDALGVERAAVGPVRRGARVGCAQSSRLLIFQVIRQMPVTPGPNS